MQELKGTCAKCPFQNVERLCSRPEGKGPDFCSTKLYTDIIAEADQQYKNDPELMRFAHNSSCQESECYVRSKINPAKYQPLKCRIEEIVEFCKKQGYHTLGLAFCIGLRNEALALNRILESHGFKVVSVICKVGHTDKSEIGVQPEEKISKSCAHESMCNPVAQAMILNAEKTEFNLMLGLCVGHDSMFIKYAEAPVTVVAVKDRLLGHNPLAALYSNYYAFLEKPKNAGGN